MRPPHLKTSRTAVLDECGLGRHSFLDAEDSLDCRVLWPENVRNFQFLSALKNANSKHSWCCKIQQFSVLKKRPHL